MNEILISKWTFNSANTYICLFRLKKKNSCYIALGNPRSAEKYLRDSLQKCAHIDTALLLARVYVKIDQPLAAIDILENSLKQFPGEVSLMTHQARILELMDNLQTSVRMHRHIAQLEPINSEALACIAVHHFYGNQPETSLLYYRYLKSMKFMLFLFVLYFSSKSL